MASAADESAFNALAELASGLHNSTKRSTSRGSRGREWSGPRGDSKGGSEDELEEEQGDTSPVSRPCPTARGV